MCFWSLCLKLTYYQYSKCRCESFHHQYWSVCAFRTRIRCLVYDFTFFWIGLAVWPPPPVFCPAMLLIAVKELIFHVICRFNLYSTFNAHAQTTLQYYVKLELMRDTDCLDTHMLVSSLSSHLRQWPILNQPLDDWDLNHAHYSSAQGSCWQTLTNCTRPTL